MKCATCDHKMKAVRLCAGRAGMEAYVTGKDKSAAQEEKRSTVECYVCPKCGIIKFKAKTPEIFGDS